jgi:phosphatidate cytidylyltransferase
MKNLIRRALTGFVFILIIVLSFVLPIEYMFILSMVISLLGMREFYKIAKRSGGSPQIGISTGMTVLLFTSLYLIYREVIKVSDFPSLLLVVSIILIIPILLTPIIELYRNKKRGLLDVALTYLPFFWIVIPLALGTMWMVYEATVVLSIFLIIWASDSFAYLSGVTFGKHRLFKRISPKKSWEGCIISLVITVLGSSFFTRIPYFQGGVFQHTYEWMGFALVVIVFGTYGDLVQSMYKRAANVKDSGKLLPGHGGILDRFDSFFFALPAGFIYWLFFIIPL